MTRHRRLKTSGGTTAVARGTDHIGGAVSGNQDVVISYEDLKQTLVSLQYARDQLKDESLAEGLAACVEKPYERSGMESTAEEFAERWILFREALADACGGAMKLVVDVMREFPQLDRSALGE